LHPVTSSRSHLPDACADADDMSNRRTTRMIEGRSLAV